MKKILIIKILLLLFSNISFSQKKQYFFDEKKNIITEKEYNHFKNENFEFTEFLAKLKQQPTTLQDCTNVSQYKSLIEEIYNYRRREKINLRF